MSQRALLRSVKGLGIPGTARKEDRKTKLKLAAPAAALLADERNDHFALRNGVRCAGVHLIVDLHGAERLDDVDHIGATLRRCVTAARATLLHIHLHHFHPNGVSGVAVLAESHISIHTWPERDFAAIDIFMCGACDPRRSLPMLSRAFTPARIALDQQHRGRIA